MYAVETEVSKLLNKKNGFVVNKWNQFELQKFIPISAEDPQENIKFVSEYISYFKKLL